MPLTYVYCIIEGDAAPPPELSGLDGGGVRAVGCGEFALWVGDSGERPAATVARVRAHDRVCAAALASVGTPLPLRFGQVHADDDAARRAVEARARDVRSVFVRVRGAVEASLVLPAPVSEGTARPLPTGASNPGRRYLERVAERYRLERVVQAELGGMIDSIDAALASLARERARTERAGSPPVVILSHLIDAPLMERYRELAFRLAESWPGGRPVVAGPSAPYSFAALALAEGAGGTR